MSDTKVKYMLTTRDNPWNPFTQFDEWYAWDHAHGYYTCEYLARIAMNAPDLSEAQNDRADEDAIDEIIFFNLTGNYVKVTKDDYDDWVPSDELTNGAKH